MNRKCFFSRAVVVVLVAALLYAPFLRTAKSQNLSNGEPNQPRLALAHSFQAEATASDRGVLVEWRTGFELDNLGFNIYRVQHGQRTQLNSGLIAGSALTFRQRAKPGEYAWLDPEGTRESEYYVESIDLRGQSNTHDVIRPEWSASLPNRAQSLLLSELGAHDRLSAKQEEWPAEFPDKSSQTSIDSISPSSLSDQWNLVANQPALKVAVRSDDWYRITQPELAAAGFNTSADASNLRMFVGGIEIAMSVSRTSGALGSADYIEFWGQGLDTATTDTQIYWLVNGAQAGKRIAIGGELHPNAGPPQPLPVSSSSPSPPLTGRELPAFLLPGLMNQVLAEKSAPSAVASDGARQIADGSDSDRDGRRQTDGSERSAVGGPRSSAGQRPPLTEASGPKAVGSNQQVVNNNSRFKTSDSKLRKNNSKLRTRNSKLRARRHRHNRARLRRKNHATLTLAPAPNFIYNVQRKDRTNAIYFTAALNGDQENFYGEIVIADFGVTPNPTSLAFTLNNLETTSAATAQVTVSLQGVSLITHQVNVLVNDVSVGTITIAQQDAATQTFSLPVSLLVEGNNTVKLVGGLACSASPCHDTTLVDYVRIAYPHSFKPDNDSLQFSVKSTVSARIDGFTNSNIRVLDLSDPVNVQAIHPIVETSGPGYALTVLPNGRGKGRRIVALPATQLSHPASITLNTPSNLHDQTDPANAADLVVISYKDFIPSLTAIQPPSSLSFVALRQSQPSPNYSVKVVDVEDVFDEFSYGVHTPQAIRDFLSLATTTWSKKPGYVMLLGDASYDPRNYQGYGNFDFVPTKLIDTGFKNDATSLETASDDWLVDFDGNGIADISIGRLPVRTLAEANLVIGKIVNYTPSTPPQSVLLVADTQGSYYWNFEQSDDDIAALLPASLTKQKVYRRLQPSDAQANINIANQINAGQVLVVYSGHGNTNIWGGSIFASDDSFAAAGRGATSLTNGNKLPFLVVMDCLNGYFIVPQPSGQSLAEAIVKAPNGGAVGSFASSGLTIPDGQHAMGTAMFQLLYPAGGSTIPIGDAGRQAKVSTNDIDVRRTWILFGDPTMKIR